MLSFLSDKAKRSQFSAGQSLVEILLAVGLMAVLLPALIVGLVATREGKPQEKQRLQAASLLVQTQEVLRSVRESDWQKFAVDGTWHTVATPSGWALATGSATIGDGFTQMITISDVYRATSGAIVATPSAGILDLSTKLITNTISWTQPYYGYVSATSYFTRYLGTANLLQTTQADFQAGTTSGTVIANLQGGEVTLGSGNGQDWCQPVITQYSYTLPGSGQPNLAYAIPGNVYIGTNGNSSGDSFGHVIITYDVNGTPSISYVGLRMPGNKTNAVAGDSTYGYLATTKGLTIVPLSTMLDSGNSTPITAADSVAVSGNTLFMTNGSTLYSINITNKNSPSIIGQVGIAGTGMKTVIIGNTAYIATNSNTTQLQMVNISNPASMSIIRSISMGNSLAGQDVAVNPSGTRAYVITVYSAGHQNYFIIDTSNGNILGSYNTNGMNPSQVAVAGGNRSVIVGTGGETYQVLNISNESTPTHCGGVTTTYPIYGIVTLTETNSNNYSYLITGDTAQFKIIQGGSGGEYSNNGTFTSSIYDARFPTAFNYFTATISQPSQTSIQMQVSVATSSAGVCPTSPSLYTFVGPNATTSAYFTPVAASISGVIPFSTSGTYLNPQRCYRYKAYFSSSDQTQTPVLYDVNTTFTP